MTYNDLLAAHACDYHLLVVLRWDLKVHHEVLEDLRHLLWLVFMDHMTHLIKDYKLELALHLSDG